MVRQSYQGNLLGVFDRVSFGSVAFSGGSNFFVVWDNFILSAHVKQKSVRTLRYTVIIHDEKRPFAHPIFNLLIKNIVYKERKQRNTEMKPYFRLDHYNTTIQAKRGFYQLDILSVVVDFLYSTNGSLVETILSAQYVAIYLKVFKDNVSVICKDSLSLLISAKTNVSEIAMKSSMFN